MNELFIVTILISPMALFLWVLFYGYPSLQTSLILIGVYCLCLVLNLLKGAKNDRKGS